MDGVGTQGSKQRIQNKKLEDIEGKCHDFYNQEVLVFMYIPKSSHKET